MKKLLFIVVLLIIISCDHRVKFVDAMPPGVEKLNEIPELFLGSFICESDSSRLHIDKYLAIKESHYVFETSIDKIMETENCSLVAGGLYLPGRKECIPFEYLSGDSITAKVYDLDTIFAFRKNEAIKYHLGHLFINYMNKNKEWDTWLFTPQPDGKIIFEFVAVPDNEYKIKDVTKDYKSRIDSKEKIHYTLNPTKKEFEEILRKEFLFECDILIPIDLEKEYNF